MYEWRELVSHSQLVWWEFSGVLMNNSHRVLQREWSKGKRRCPGALPCCALMLSLFCITWTHSDDVETFLLLSFSSTKQEKKKGQSFLDWIIKHFPFIVVFFDILLHQVWPCPQCKPNFLSTSLVLSCIIWFVNNGKERSPLFIWAREQPPSTSLSCRSDNECTDWLTDLQPHGKAADVTLD